MQATAAPPLLFDKRKFQDEVLRLIPKMHTSLKRAIRSYVLFNMLFLALGSLEFIGLVLFFSDLAKSSVLAISLGVIFLTVFSYFILRLYLQAHKPEQLMRIRDTYLDRCRALIDFREGVPEHHMALAGAAYRFASELRGKETDYYLPPGYLDALRPSCEKFSCFWHWIDLHRFREMLLTYSIEEHIKVVKCEPTNLEVHAALANAYVMLSTIYVDPRTAESHEDEHWVPSEQFLEELKEKFRSTAERAIEEFKILSDYAPNDPWIHSQLAYSYHDLQMPQEEIKQYEIILKLRPNDRETLFKLGTLYFQQGENAKGLKVYEALKRSNYKQAENLINFYGAFSREHPFPGTV